MERHLFCGVAFVGVMLACAPAALAQAEWSSIAKIVKGTCADKAIAQVRERPGSMQVKLSANGRQYAEIDLKLAADGSGRSEFPGSLGLILLEVSAGTGKRSMKTTQVKGLCQWLWTPS
jgi:hypothetical protein